jgi:DNA invertase Pin-like site-specific DNA recombinase
MVEEKVMKAVGYVRVSTTGQIEGESLATQRERITTFCQAHGYNLVDIYADEGFSGASTKKRPAFLRMLRDAQAGRFNCLVVCDLSRFGRNARDALNNYEELEGHGIKLVILKENIDTSTPSGRLFRTMLAGFAEYERDVIKERMHVNRDARWKKGGTFIGKVPFGYRWNKEQKRLEVNPQEAKTYQRIVKMYVDQGMSYLDIALALKHEGIKCKRAYFSQVAISYILKNPVYYGNYVVNRHQYDGNRRVYEGDKRKRTPKLKPMEEQITIDVPALISKTEWDKIQAKREFNTKKSKRISQAADHWLRDLLVCQECGGPIKPHSVGRVRKDGTYPRYYGCLYHSVTAKRLEIYGRERCKLPLIKAEDIEAQVWYKLISTLTFGGFELGGEYRAPRLEEMISTAHYDDEIARLDAAYATMASDLKAKERAKGRVMALIDCDDYDETEFRQRFALVKEDIITIKAAIEDNRAKAQELQHAKKNNDEFLKFIRYNQKWMAGLAEQLNRLAPEDKKLLAESLVPGKIGVFLGQFEEDESGPEWAISTFLFAFNTAIFERLAAEGKLKGEFPKNDSNHPGAPWPHPLEQGQDFSRHHRHSPRRGGREGGPPGRGMAEERDH